VRAGMTSAAANYPWSSAQARLGMTPTPAWLDLNPWAQEWTPNEWLKRLGDDNCDEVTRVELQEATLGGHPLGAALSERLERELGRRLHRGKMGRPPKPRAEVSQGSLFG